MNHNSLYRTSNSNEESPSLPPPPLPPGFISSDIPPPPIPPFPPPYFPNPSFPYSAPTFQDNSVSTWNAPYAIHDHFSQQFPQKVEEVQTSVTDQEWIDSWLKIKKQSMLLTKEPIKSDVKIFFVREKLNSAFRLIKELENAGRTLGVMVKTVSPPEWDQKCNEIEEKKIELSSLLTQLKLCPEEVTSLKEKCLKRSKKRARLKRQAERRKREKEEQKVKNKNLSFQIDNWQKEMRDEAERIQREEELQKEADAVLWGVTQKKTETRRQIALLSALLELRQVRVKRLTAAGNPVSQSQIETFNTVIERLKKMWSRNLNECLLEEQALRGMLDHAREKEDPVKTYKKLVLQEWEIAIFGSLGSLDSNPKGQELIDLRRSWDQFAVSEQTVLSTTIPPGWVLPVPPSSDDWHALLKY